MRKSLPVVAAEALLVLLAFLPAAASAPPHPAAVPQLPQLPQSRHSRQSPRVPAESCPRGHVALTFDDGPSPTTLAILGALRHGRQAHATFFTIGAQEQRHPELVRAVARAGHEIGDHTYSHPYLDELSATAAAREILGTQQIHEQLTGVRERLFRPPYGRTSPAIRAVAGSLGMTEVLWTIDAKDYLPTTTVRDIVTRALSAHDGDIVLLHDAGYTTTVAAVPAILEGLARRGLCPGRVVPTRWPVTAWPGMRFSATAAAWSKTG
jgi:peptidoglycan/xylan/chitin deacetylase (PgdA/CDA1 family)